MELVNKSPLGKRWKKGVGVFFFGVSMLQVPMFIFGFRIPPPSGSSKLLQAKHQGLHCTRIHHRLDTPSSPQSFKHTPRVRYNDISKWHVGTMGYQKYYILVVLYSLLLFLYFSTVPVSIGYHSSKRIRRKTYLWCFL